MSEVPTRRWPLDSFVELPPDAMSLLEECMHQRSFEQDEHLVRQGDIGEEMFVITSGHVLVTTEDQDGQRHVIARSGPGDIVGEMALLTREPRTADAIAREPVVAQVLPATAFHTLTDRYPEFSHFLTRLVATRVGGPNRDVLVGRNMDGYRIVRRLGRGGMAVVYEAVDKDGRRVALKMMSHRLVCDEQSRQFFQREADIIESFDHPNIVRMLGRFAMFYTFFIVVEFIDGLSLQQLLERNAALPPDTVRRILGQLARALGNAHESGIIHRDIKPGNVMLTRDGQVKLMDFGLAKPVGMSTTSDRVMVGTPGYMAPELFQCGDPQPASDIFSLGCLAVELLAGRKLFSHASVGQFVAAVTSWSGWDTSSLPGEIDGELAEVLSGWLSPDPSERSPRFDLVGHWAGRVELPDELQIIGDEDSDATWLGNPAEEATFDD